MRETTLNNYIVACLIFDELNERLLVVLDGVGGRWNSSIGIKLGDLEHTLVRAKIEQSANLICHGT
jgi:hypothetical protein